MLTVHPAGTDIEIMVKGKPAVLPVLGEKLFLPLNHIQREIIIGHYPERIGMIMGSKKISHVDGTAG